MNNHVSFSNFYGQQIDEKELFAIYGWYTHFVIDACGFPNHTNIHTHGLEESFNHLDFQICLPIPAKTAHTIFGSAISKIKNGFVYEDGKEYDHLIEKFSIKTIERTESGRKVLRMIFPDKNNNYESPLYSSQFDF
jgi:hypothetical protein